VERGEKKKYKVISHVPGYHGNTLGALSVSGRPHVKALYSPLLLDFPMIPAPVCYRCPCDKTYPSCGAVCAEALDAMIRQEGPETVSAFIGEPIIGASAGAAVPPPEYYRTIREICNHYQVLFIADEILTGMGRTGSWLAIESYGILPDIILLGKGLGGGYLPLSALVARDEIVESLENGAGAFIHGQTFSHTPMICTAGLATLRYLKENQLVEQSAVMGAKLIERCQCLLDLPFVGDVRGKGLLVGIEFVADKDSKQPFPRRARVAERLYHTALNNGLVIWINTGHVDGEQGDLVMIGPPFTITEAQIEELVHQLKLTCRAVCDSF
jgi:adenosylmethionine-8-amino-7-oxononanoate aminotransferase